MTSTSKLLQNDIRLLTERLNNIGLDSGQQDVSKFVAVRRDVFGHLSDRLDSIFALQSDGRAFTDETQIALARQKNPEQSSFPPNSRTQG